MLIALRKRDQAFGRGTMEFLEAGNTHTLAFLRCYDVEVILVVANLSRFTQRLDLDLSRFAGRAPIDVFGRLHRTPASEHRETRKQILLFIRQEDDRAKLLSRELRVPATWARATRLRN